MTRGLRLATCLVLVVLWLITRADGSPGRYAGGRDTQKILVNTAEKKKSKADAIPQLLEALDVLNREYFEIWQGIWPTSIDWTSAVIGTFLASSLSTLSSSFAATTFNKTSENTINKYFSQLTSSYFGQDAFAIRQEAYDDMLWVVLGWIEAVKFVELHTWHHYNGTIWHGQQFVPAFAHRARVFWELASQGWDTKYCEGGMLWSPYLIPYKNAITNELFIAASIQMYLHFPGDDNESPFAKGWDVDGAYLGGKERDPMYLNAALEGYEWLVESDMRNDAGLYVDGYHISGRFGNQCDARNEMVYTYNQGVLLTGQRGLYEATGNKRFLEDGHQLISDVIRATGWDLERDETLPEESGNDLPRWRGLGRSGILEEACDLGAYCSQDSQTFKGIFFHHLTAFCDSIPKPLIQQVDNSKVDLNKWHTQQCQRYEGWVTHNTRAALRTRDGRGRFGMWWNAPQNPNQMPDLVNVVLPKDAVDYRNKGLPDAWDRDKRVIHKIKTGSQRDTAMVQDLNDRGRGRTVETQGGGISMLRAFAELR